jgi:hypothetical protein
MYRFPSIGVPVNVRSTTTTSFNLPFGSSQEVKAISLPSPIGQHPVTSIAPLQSASAVNLKQSIGCPDDSGLGTFRITLVRPLHFCGVPNMVPSTLRWSEYILAPTYGDAPTQCFNDLSTAEIHSPPAFPRGARSFGFIVTPILREAPTLHRCISKTISTETRKLLAALGYQPRTYTSLSLPSA